MIEFESKSEPWDPWERNTLASKLLLKLVERGPETNMEGADAFPPGIVTVSHREPVDERVALAIRYADALIAALAKGAPTS